LVGEDSFPNPSPLPQHPFGEGGEQLGGVRGKGRVGAWGKGRVRGEEG